ncbi:hypothetical protein J6590_006707 [Homalodisca vitripennis]|nr:hypothetical protein J6590_006707 [Homalodisca vitripennis]
MAVRPVQDVIFPLSTLPTAARACALVLAGTALHHTLPPFIQRHRPRAMLPTAVCQRKIIIAETSRGVKCCTDLAFRSFSRTLALSQP